MIDGVLLDLSGVLHVGTKALPRAVTALQRLRNSGLPLRFVTNTTRSTRGVVGQAMRRLGFDIDDEEIFTAPRAGRAYIDAHGLRPLLIIHPGVEQEFAGVAQQQPNAVLVGDAGEAFDYRHLNRAFRLLMEGAPLLALGRNRYFRDDDGFNLDAGPFVAALEYAADVRATVLGKPAVEFYHSAVDALGCPPERVVMVGDDVDADVLGAAAAGLRGILVRTGKYRASDEVALDGVGTVACADLAAAVEWILARAGD